jgi:CRISPR-associated exonuclease Cas4
MADAERVFEPDLYSERLHLSGRPDLVLIGRDESVPVEFKLTDREPGANQLAQLGVYALLIDETNWPPARRGFVRLIPSRRTFELSLDAELRRTILRSLAAMREVLVADERPAATPVRSRCRACEYRRFCPDIESGP